MNERLLQFIWQFQYFNRADLQSEQGAKLQIIQPGIYNVNQGPDFLEAMIRVDDTLLVGNIELHINSSDWDKHGHHRDANYKNVILHVVWKHDMSEHPAAVPLLVIESRVSILLLGQYDAWMQQTDFVPCASMLKDVSEITWALWMERLTAERLQRKSNYVLQVAERNKYHWEETCWQLIARNFGGPVNADAFENIARSLPLGLLAKHKNQPILLEALLLGQAGLLEQDFTDAYALLLQREYRFQQHKYQLKRYPGNVFFLRMRPAAFPTIRLSQLAMLLHQSAQLFTSIREINSIKELRKLFNVQANDYWHYHYRFDEPAVYQVKNTGNDMLDSLMINTIPPLLFGYGSYHQEQALKDKALEWLTLVKAEKNNIVSGWQQLGVATGNAFLSQALIELKTQYCDKKRCLDCAAGNNMLKEYAKNA